MAKSKSFGQIGRFAEGRCCSLPKTSKKFQIEAARRAIGINPANAPARLRPDGGATVLDTFMSPEHIAVITSKYWGPQGRTLNVSFMEKTDPPLVDKILSHMNAWYDQGANIQFQYKASGGDVRISRGPGGYWSYIGPDILGIPQNQQTMNLEGFVLATPDSEYYRVIRHETGHTLGFPHEHARKEIVALLSPQKVQTYFQRTQGWSAQEINEQILTPLDDATLMDTPADVTSIMCYQFPGNVTLSGNPIPGGTDINPSDAAFAAKLYPRAVSPSGGGNGGTSGGGTPPAGQIVIDPAAKTYSFPTGWNPGK